MKYENEITVEVDIDLYSLIKLLESKGFTLKEEYTIDDIYMVNKENIDKYDLSLLGKCVLIRDINDNSGNKKMLTYKYKEYNELEEITKQGKIKVNVDDIENTKLLFLKLGFIELISIYDKSYVYATDNDELVIQCVNDKHIYIEIEDKCYYANRVYNSIDEMKSVIINNNIPIKSYDYFVKKAYIELKEQYNK